MKRRTKKLLAITAVPIAAGLIVGSVTSQLTMNYLDHRLEQMVVERQSNGKAGVIAAVSQMQKNAVAPYRELTIENEPVATSQAEDVAGLTFTDEESTMLMKLAMAEGENQGVRGKALIMCVVHNRKVSDKFPDTIEGVIFEEVTKDYHQFSVIDDGRFEAAVPDDECYQALEMVLNHWDESEGALFFEADWNENKWHKDNLQELFQYQNLIFYKEK